MQLNQIYHETPALKELQISLEAHKQALVLVPIPLAKQQTLRRRSLLHSAVYSARIENNPLTPETFVQSSQHREKLEIQNILDSLNWIYHPKRNLIINEDLLRNLHRQVMHGLDSTTGHFRTDSSAVFNSAGIAIYLAPPASEVKPLITFWLSQLHDSALPPPIQIAISHYQFEKIHPFLDGNGRVGRLLTTILLKNCGLDLHGTVSFEKYISDHRDDYYYYLGQDRRDLTQFIEYFLTAINSMQQQALTLFTSPDLSSPNLFSRQQEILAIISDHPHCSFDFIRRRFFAVPTSTLHYDLQQLQKKGLVFKTGMTRGVLYTTPLSRSPSLPESDSS